MNERIRELYYQCQDESLSTEECYHNFAELIIQECASFADKHNQQKLYEDYTLGVGKAIKKHFGVEE